MFINNDFRSSLTYTQAIAALRLPIAFTASIFYLSVLMSIFRFLGLMRMFISCIYIEMLRMALPSLFSAAYPDYFLNSFSGFSSLNRQE